MQVKSILFYALFAFTSVFANDALYVNEVLSDLTFTNDKEVEIQNLKALIVQAEENSKNFQCYHAIKQIDYAQRLITLSDDSTWRIGLLYGSDIKNWTAGNRLKVSIYRGYSNNIKFVNIDILTEAWGVVEKVPAANVSDYIIRISPSVQHSDGMTRIILNNGLIFKCSKNTWNVRDIMFVFHGESKNKFDLWNITKNEYLRELVAIGNEKQGQSNGILTLEEKLNLKVLGQKSAINTVSASIFNYWAGLNDPKTPIGVFLFLGPTGVGKTELAKALTDELYNSRSHLVRFDMSHFVESHSAARLVGSPPGYANHEEGGQLTQALRAKPRSIVLLDEMEKAHPAVRKIFLPVFDEGYINDSKNRQVLCNHAIFIMTSNICSSEIAELFNAGYSSEEVLQAIEPAVIQILSPELYNRVIPVVFHPLTFDLMEGLVTLMLQDVTKRLMQVKKIDLNIDQSVKKYLAIKGFHPTLGARPLKKLIQNKVVAFLSYAIVNEGIPNGSKINIYYNDQDDAWHIDWKSK